MSPSSSSGGEMLHTYADRLAHDALTAQELAALVPDAARVWSSGDVDGARKFEQMLHAGLCSDDARRRILVEHALCNFQRSRIET